MTPQRDHQPGAVLIAGAGPGISGHLARIFAAEGHPLGLLGMDQEVLDDLVAAVAEHGVATQTAVVDLTDGEATRAAVTSMGERLGRVDVVHFNPSAFREKDPLELTPAELAQDVSLGVGALLTLVQAARPFLASGSRVTVTGSMAADKPWNRAASLGVQKAAVRNLVHSLDTTLKDDGIRAVSVTVQGALAQDGPFTHAKVARAIRAALDQDEQDWRSEVSYAG